MSISYYKDIYALLCKRHPNRKVFVISDHHFYHFNIIKYSREEFNNVWEMNEYIINKHNHVVGSDDIVIFLGDFSFKKSLIKEILDKMNGHKYLIVGNHDSKGLERCYGNLGFEQVFMQPVKIKNDFFSHFPLKQWEVDSLHLELLVQEFEKSNGINYHGHIHTTDVGMFPFVNVCCEAQNYEPLLIGYTEGLLKSADLPLIINSKYFEEILISLKEKNKLNPSLIISDYIYSLFLEKSSSFSSSSFVYGSYPLYKKYGYISNFSDLDVCLVYNEEMSKSQNQKLLKKMADTVFDGAKEIDFLNLSFDKRVSNMCIFELLYANGYGNTYSGYYDANLVPLDLYRDSDFITVHQGSTLEKMLRKEETLLNQFRFPHYDTRFLTVNGDIANLSLQLLFHRDLGNRNILAYKKLNNIYRLAGNCESPNSSLLEDSMTRFFIRNIMFFHTARRVRDIEYINAGYNNLDSFLNSIPFGLRVQMEEILKNPNSLFNRVYKELGETSFSEIPSKSKELIKRIKEQY